MKRLIILPILILFLLVTGCGSRLTTEKRENDSITGVSAEDAEMNRIIEEARASVDVFLSALTNPNTQGTNFLVKYPFDTKPGSPYDEEHIWLSGIEVLDQKYYGIVMNDPFYIKNMQYGDRVEFDIHRISDWQYTDVEGYLVGGKSILYFYEKMSEEEKLDFEKQVEFKIRKE